MPRTKSPVEPDLLPDDTGEEWAGGEDAAVERLEQEPRPHIEPPFELGDPFFTVPAHVKNISLGRPVSNVTATLSVALDYPWDGFTDLMGEHALAAVFGDSFLGNGIRVLDVALHTDVENEVTQRVKLSMPRYDDGKDQLAAYVAPLLEDPSVIDRLLNYAGPWRLNLPVNIEGSFSLYEPQERFDLTARADDEDDD